MRTLVVALGVVGLLAGCGDDSKATTTVAPGLSKSEYLARFKQTIASIDAGPKIEAPQGASPSNRARRSPRASIGFANSPRISASSTHPPRSGTRTSSSSPASGRSPTRPRRLPWR